MKETEVQTIYDSPSVKVVEIKVRQVLCQSSGINTMGFGTDQNDSAFN